MHQKGWNNFGPITDWTSIDPAIVTSSRPLPFQTTSAWQFSHIHPSHVVTHNAQQVQQFRVFCVFLTIWTLLSFILKYKNANLLLIIILFMYTKYIHIYLLASSIYTRARVCVCTYVTIHVPYAGTECTCSALGNATTSWFYCTHNNRTIE